MKNGSRREEEMRKSGRNKVERRGIEIHKDINIADMP